MDLIVSFPDGITPNAVQAEVDELLSLGVTFDGVPETRWHVEEEPQIDPKFLKLPSSGSQRQAVLLAILAGDKTPDEIADELRCANSSVDGRVLELRQGGYIKATDQTRPTPWGGRAAVLTATQKARTECRLAPKAWFPGAIRPATCQ